MSRSTAVNSIISALGTASAAGRAAYCYLLRQHLPKIRGSIRIDGLQDRVEVIRDRWGVPHVYARSQKDMFFAQGYVHAQDRLWQMELNRRIATGTLSEALGAATLEVDRFMRIVGFRRAAEEEAALLETEERDILEAYCQGINAFLKDNRHWLPLELILLRFSPRPWSVIDCLAWTKLMSWGISVNWDAELVRLHFTEALGEEVPTSLDPGYSDDQPVIVRHEKDHGLNTRDEITETPGLPGFSGGSNSWAVDGDKTVSGSPLLANDPHLIPQIPSPWYEIHLCAGDIDVIGASIPGMPGVIIGHNRNIAWGITAAMVDVQDLYQEDIHPSEPDRYRHDGRWLEVRAHSEVIRVKGWTEPWVEHVKVTHHGPIITPILRNESRTFALKSTILEPQHLYKGGLLLLRASNWDEFRTALRHRTSPSLNFTYSDTSGNIGYQLAGSAPIRGRGNGQRPSPGWDPTYDWQGYIPFQDLPH
ncbi:MAG: penicillin acylase family protein, partial [Dehalococcoidia bacterium]|nr:penicillin acylase family protein [Dehalococcoidia bacterium]